MEIIKTFEPGEIIFNEGDACDSLYIIKVGSVEIFKQKADREIVLNEQKAGEVIGLLTFFTNGRRLASARAKTPVEGVLIYKGSGSEADSIANLPQWVQIVLKDFTVRLDQMNERFISSAIEVEEIKSKLQDPLFISIQVANCVSEWAQAQAVKGPDGSPVLLYENLKTALSRCLEYDMSTLDRVFAIFDSSDLLKIEKAKESQKSYISLQTAQNLAWYPQFFRSAPAENKRLFKSPLSEAQAAVLLALCDYVEKTGGRLDQMYQVEVSLIASCLENLVGIAYEPSAIEAARIMGLIELEETPQLRRLKFHPEDLRRSLQIIDIVKRLRSDPHCL